MVDRHIQRARDALGFTDTELARSLGVTTGCLRSWSRRGAPRYAQLALAALIFGLDPDRVLVDRHFARASTVRQVRAG